ncbi:MAG: CPBP family intramembrane glutamic endopeptidase [Ktedonobacterales bacterium]
MTTLRAFVQRHPVLAYLGMTYLISWGGALLVVAPKLLQGKPISQVDGLLMFPVMLLGPSVTGITLTAIAEGSSGLRRLFARMGRWRVGVWYLVLLVPPVLVLAVLFSLRAAISPAFTPSYGLFSIFYGILPGFVEEIGWMGFVYPHLKTGRSPLTAALVLGVLWGLWHLPVIDFLGAAYPHGVYLLPMVCAFVVAMTAMRVLIVWAYSSTGSLLLAQLLHTSSTASLAVFSPSLVSPAQEPVWYAVYAVALWVVVALVVVTYGRQLTRQLAPVGTLEARTSSV